MGDLVVNVCCWWISATICLIRSAGFSLFSNLKEMNTREKFWRSLSFPWITSSECQIYAFHWAGYQTEGAGSLWFFSLFPLSFLFTFLSFFFFFFLLIAFYFYFFFSSVYNLGVPASVLDRSCKIK